MGLKAVAFDIDGTLYSNTRMQLQSLPFVLCHARLLSAFGRVRRQLRLIRPIEDFHGLQAELFGREIGESAARAAEIIDTLFYRRWERVLERVPLFPEVVATVEAFRGAGLKVAVASDFPVRRKLSILGLEGLWQCEISTEEVGYLKPNPEPFQALLECLGEQPRQVLYVGNSYRYDVEGAKAVGMVAAHLVKRPPAQSIADFSFHRFAELRRWVLTRLDE
ncbi:MAG: HAD family hydrolase [Spirochaetaceae bacterium]|nr:MAG: HAD family hydrolase [Spirochaetaceae bacterium]